METRQLVPNCYATSGCTVEDCICPTIAKLDDKISKTKSLLSELTKQRDAAYRQINHYHKPFINRLPVELISNIFIDMVNEFPYEIGRNFRIPLQLGAVCQLWRDITLATPQLWTSINIEVKLCRNPRNIDMAREWLRRSCSSPLSIRVNFHDCARKCAEYGLDSKLDAPMLAILRSHSTRWSCLEISGNCPYHLHQLVDNLQDSPPADLLHLSVGWCEYGSGAFDVDHILLPRSISQTGSRLRGIGLWDLPCGWDRLTHLEMDNVTTDEVLYFFQNAPNIAECKASIIRDEPAPDFFVLSTIPIVAHHLTHLDTCSKTSHTDIFNRLTLPALRTLHHEYYSISREEDFSSLVSCLQRSSPPLQEFELAMTVFYSDIADWYERFPTLTSLNIDASEIYRPHMTMDGCIVTEKILAVLGRRRGAALVLPKLQSLRLVTQGMNEDSWAYLCNIFQESPDHTNYDLELNSARRAILKNIEIEVTEEWKRDFGLEREIFERFEDLKALCGVELKVNHIDRPKFGVLKHAN